MFLGLRYLLLPGLLCFAMHSQALVLNRVMTFTERLRGPTPVLLGERLFFADSADVLRVTDGTPGGSLALLTGIPSFAVERPIVVLNNLVYVIREAESGNFELWVTDGTRTNTQRALDLELPPFSFQQRLVALEGLLFLSDANGNLIVSDGTVAGTQVITGADPLLATLCVIDENNFYYQGIVDNGGPLRFAMLHFVDGELNEVQLDARYELAFPTRAQKVADNCVYAVDDLDNTVPIGSGVTDTIEQFLLLDRNGQQRPYLLPTDFVTAENRTVISFPFQDRLIVSRSRRLVSGAVPAGGFFELQPSNDELVAIEFTVPGTDAITVRDIQIQGDVIFALFTPSFPGDPPPLTSIGRFDSNFELIDRVSSRTRDRTLTNLDILSTQGDTLLYFLTTQNLDTIEATERVPVLRISDVANLRFTAESGEALYAFGTEALNGVTGLYRLQETPRVSERLAGLWANDQLERQGVQINTALDADGRTRLLFMSLLAHFDGMPIWLSGGAPIVDGASSIQLNLSLFTGLPFLETAAGAGSQQQMLGRATLTVLGCNQIRVQFDLQQPFGARDLIFERLIDQSFATLCNDG